VTASARSAARWQSLIALLIAMGVLVDACQALAHARVLRSQPADKAQLSQAPSRLDLWFNELLDAGFNTVEVFSAKELTAKQRANLVKGAPQVDPADRTHLTVELQPLPPGEYIVDWRVLSRDGHSAPGRFRFHVLNSP
jgi:methionine-rich copper-binding protein CopC